MANMNMMEETFNGLGAKLTELENSQYNYNMGIYQDFKNVGSNLQQVLEFIFKMFIYEYDDGYDDRLGRSYSHSLRILYSDIESNGYLENADLPALPNIVYDYLDDIADMRLDSNYKPSEINGSFQENIWFIVSKALPWVEDAEQYFRYKYGLRNVNTDKELITDYLFFVGARRIESNNNKYL